MAPHPEILLLRPFWDADVTAAQVKAIARAVKGIGKLVAFRNGRENTRIRLVDDKNPWSRFGSLMERCYNKLNPAIDLRLIASTDDDWQRHVIHEVMRCDAVILHLAPREKQSRVAFAPIEPGRALQKSFARLSNPVHESGTGHGLLRELEYCRQASALAKTVVLIPTSFHDRVSEALSALNTTTSGIQFYAVNDRGLLPLQPRMSTFDQVLTALKEVHAVVPYERFGSDAFNGQLRCALNSCLSSSMKTSTRPVAQVPTGIPSGPIALPPDGALKWIRFSKLESLTKIPPMEIVELSIDEVKRCGRDVLEYFRVCKGCGRGSEVMFFYQRGLTPRLVIGTPVQMDCQYCGFRDYY